MTYVKYLWTFDSSVEGWTGDNLQWEEGGQGGIPTGHLYGYKSQYTSGFDITFPVTFKSPRDLNIVAGDILCFVFTWDGSVGDLKSRKLVEVTVEVVDADGTVVWSKTVGVKSSPANTPTVCIVKIDGNGVGFNVKVDVYTKSDFAERTHTHYARLDSVTVYEQPDQIIHTPIPSTLQSTVTHEIPINKSGNYVIGAMRFDDIQNLSSYDEKLIYDTSSEYDYGNGVSATVTSTTSVDKITISHNADATLQVYYECEHAVWLLDGDTWTPKWLTIIRCYHNQNITNPDTVSFSAVLDGTNPYTETKTMSLKFTASGLFKLNLTPSREVVSGDLSDLTQLDAVITVKDSSNNTIGTCNYDMLNDTYDNPIAIDKTYDNQDLTLEITVTANGLPSITVTVKLKLNFEFTY